MATRQQLLSQINKATYTAKEVIHLLSSLTLDPILPPYIRKGDVYTERVGHKRRPCCVIKVVGSLAYSIPLSTTQDEQNLIKGKMPRFSTEQDKDSYFSKGIVITPVSVVMENYLWAYENNAMVNKAIREMRKHMEIILK